VVQAEREQMMRNVISALPARCKELVHMLFFEDPPVPYQEVAERLGIATGSIGFIRQRCLGRLKKSVTELRVTW
jgi:RNA polymerase sigma factor (sigma-70 family)